MAHQQLGHRLTRTGVQAIIALALAGTLACAGQTVSPVPATVNAPTAHPAAQTPVTVRLGSSGALGQAGQQLAERQGYFAQEGLRIDFVKVDASTVFTTVIAGQVDVQGLGLDVGLFSAIQRGLEFRVIATQASAEPNANGVFLVARKDFIETGGSGPTRTSRVSSGTICHGRDSKRVRREMEGSG